MATISVKSANYTFFRITDSKKTNRLHKYLTPALSLQFHSAASYNNASSLKLPVPVHARTAFRLFVGLAGADRRF
jgi:hypothetical protein